MDLLSRTIIAMIIVIAVIVVIYYASQHVFPGGMVTKEQAASLVQSYLANHNPNAVVNVTNITPSQFAGSWHIVVSFINNPTRACPSYFIYSFDYPKYGFVNRTEYVYTQNCTISGLIANQSYVIGSYPVAIARSTSLNTSNVTSYLRLYGYNNTVVTATYYNATEAISGRNYSKVWVVNYNSQIANRSVYNIIAQVNGNLLASGANPH